jgi:hypothetical protein
VKCEDVIVSVGYMFFNNKSTKKGAIFQMISPLHEVPSEDENALKFTLVMVSQVCDHTKDHWLVRFKWVKRMTCELYLKKLI